jgi:valyl-tRNA synthetase
MIKGCERVVVIEGGSSIPDGCAPYNISEETNVHLLVRGMIDFDLEVEKIDKKINSIQSSQNAILKRQESAGYEKSPLKVREADEAKVCRDDIEL